MRLPQHESDLTEELLEEVLELAAITVEYYGPKYIPLFECIERKLAEVRARDDAHQRIRKLLRLSPRGERPVKRRVDVDRPHDIAD